MYRYGLIAAVAFGAVALVSGTSSANVATGGFTTLNAKPFASSIEEVRRHRVCHRKCNYVGPFKKCRRRCWWR